MEKTMKRYFTFIFLFALIGCELVVDVDIPIEKRALVLNSFFNPDSVWRAKVSLNRHILDDFGFPYVDDAEVIVFEGEVPIDTLQHDSLGYYKSDHVTAHSGKFYTLRATAPGYNKVESTSTCPEKVAVEMSPIEQSTGEFGGAIYSFSLTFTDPPDQNFYQIAAIREYRYQNPQTGQGFVSRNPIQILSDDTGIDDEQIPNGEGFFFPDALFNGNRFTVNVKMTPNRWGSQPQDSKYFIYFRTISQDYYKYKVTSLLQDYTSGDPFAQPVNVYNNIANGFGIFAGYTQTVFIYEE
jgi:hypothetical protein